MFSFLLKLKRRIKRLLKVQTESRQTLSHSTRGKILRMSYLLVATILIGVLYPGESLYDPLDMPLRGEVSFEDVIAPFPITVFKTDRDLKEEREVIRMAAPPVIDCDTLVLVQVETALDKMLKFVDSLRTGREGIAPDTAELINIISDRYLLLSEGAIRQTLQVPNLDSVGLRIRTIFRKVIYEIGVLPDNAVIPQTPNKSILVRRGAKENIYARDRLHQLAGANVQFLTALNRLYAVDSIDVEYHYLLGRSFIRPNLRVNKAEYNARIEKELEQISNVKELVSQGDIIIRSGQRIDQRQEQILKEMTRLQRSQASEEGFIKPYLPVLARIALVLSILALLFAFLKFFRKELYASNQKLLAILLVFAAQLFLMQLVDRWELSGYLYPVAFAPIVLTILFDIEIGVMTTIVLAMLLGVMHRFDFDLSLMVVTIGMSAAFASRSVRRRSHFFRIMGFTALAYVLFILIVENLKLNPGADLMSEVGFGILNGVISSFLVIGVLPVFESLFSITTDITLLELSDMNHPLLKRLAMEAPGTYHHSIIVGNLSESAAKAIGGNSLLCRVGAYYHDIGKIEIPEYFVENQLGIKSKHEMLTPSMSSIILSSHVKKGRLLGEIHDIPDDVLNFIEEHHGTMVQIYFYSKAMKETNGQVDKDKFRYPGPKPQTRETGIAMLADAVEAASRTLDDPKPARINNLIQRIIDERFQSGELDECPLTLRDLARIKDAFAQVLIGAFHHRIDYPKKEEADK
ncbi:MAG: HDIG domain-containing protein [bacterium]|nr:HDIG domain-containing protein [bacterium]